MNLSACLLPVLVVQLICKLDAAAESSSFDPVTYLIRYGYLSSGSVKRDQAFGGGVIGRLSGRYQMYPNGEVAEAVRAFQRLARLNATGQLDTATLKVMRMPRCGNRDIRPKRQSRHVLQGSKWSKPVLKFRVKKYPKYSVLDKEAINSELQRAFDLWARHANIEFEIDTSPITDNETKSSNGEDEHDENSDQDSSSSSSADIEIKFETGFHGDSEPFDGRGLILGHAYFPEFGGSTHFDGDELWTSKSITGVNLYQVAVHEFGHALGLEHSDNFDAIMAPFFRGYSENFELHPDDVKAIELLYGRKKRNTNSMESGFHVKSQASFINNMGDVKNGLVPDDEKNSQNTDKKIFFFIRPFNFSAVKTNFIAKTTPALYENINSMQSTNDNDKTVFSWNSVTSRPLSTYRMPYKLTTFIPTYDGSQFLTKLMSPRTTTPPYDQSVNLCLDGRFDAISILADGNMYIFKDAYVFKFDSSFLMDTSYPRLIKNVFRGWDGITLPIRLDTVLHISERDGTGGVTYFFKNNLFWRSSRLYELDAGYPRPISSFFLGLNAEHGFGGRLDASFVWGGNGRVYFVEGNKYWRFDFELGAIEAGYPKRFDSVWHGLPPHGITDAFQWRNGATYFFAHDKYYRFNDFNMRVEDATWPSYPRPNNLYWFGCEYNYNKLGKLSSIQPPTTHSAVVVLNDRRFELSPSSSTNNTLEARKLNLTEPTASSQSSHQVIYSIRFSIVYSVLMSWMFLL